jgi:hypothetical protein
MKLNEHHISVRITFLIYRENEHKYLFLHALLLRILMEQFNIVPWSINHGQILSVHRAYKGGRYMK